MKKTWNNPFISILGVENTKTEIFKPGKPEINPGLGYCGECGHEIKDKPQNSHKGWCSALNGGGIPGPS
ncbi:MAG: hypothetical protein RR942_02180 [Romboutsia sp.]